MKGRERSGLRARRGARRGVQTHIAEVNKTELAHLRDHVMRRVVLDDEREKLHLLGAP